MKRVLKYVGIVALIVAILIVVFVLFGQRAVNADKESLIKLQNDSAQYFNQKGTFVGFCSSDLYKEVKQNFTYDITCWNDHLENGLQITVELASEYFLCKPANLPPVEGKTQKKLACMQTPRSIFEAIQ